MHSPDLRGCPNCGAENVEKYCANCGQRAVEELRPSLHDLLHEALHELSHVDGKIVRTIGLLLFHPGLLTLEFFQGKRARSVSPVRLYLLASVLFFGIMSVTPSLQVHFTVSKESDARLSRAAEKMNRDPSIFAHAAAAAYPKAMFILMPLFGLLVFAFYFRKERLYIPHLYFAVHYHAFAFTIFALAAALSLIHWGGIVIIRAILILAVVVCLAIALRRVYGGSRLLTAVKAAGILAIYGIALSVTMLALAYVTMRRLQT